MRWTIAVVATLLVTAACAPSADAFHWRHHHHPMHVNQHGAQAQGLWSTLLLTALPPLLNKYVIPNLPGGGGGAGGGQTPAPSITIDPVIISNVDKVQTQVESVADRFNKSFDKFKLDTAKPATGGKTPIKEHP